MRIVKSIKRLFSDLSGKANSAVTFHLLTHWYVYYIATIFIIYLCRVEATDHKSGANIMCTQKIEHNSCFLITSFHKWQEHYKKLLFKDES